MARLERKCRVARILVRWTNGRNRRFDSRRRAPIWPGRNRNQDLRPACLDRRIHRHSRSTGCSDLPGVRFEDALGMVATLPPLSEGSGQAVATAGTRTGEGSRDQQGNRGIVEGLSGIGRTEKIGGRVESISLVVGGIPGKLVCARVRNDSKSIG